MANRIPLMSLSTGSTGRIHLVPVEVPIVGWILVLPCQSIGKVERLSFFTVDLTLSSLKCQIDSQKMILSRLSFQCTPGSHQAPHRCVALICPIYRMSRLVALDSTHRSQEAFDKIAALRLRSF